MGPHKPRRHSTITPPGAGLETVTAPSTQAPDLLRNRLVLASAHIILMAGRDRSLTSTSWECPTVPIRTANLFRVGRTIITALSNNNLPGPTASVSIFSFLIGTSTRQSPTPPARTSIP